MARYSTTSSSLHFLCQIACNFYSLSSPALLPPQCPQTMARIHPSRTHRIRRSVSRVLVPFNPKSPLDIRLKAQLEGHPDKEEPLPMFTSCCPGWVGEPPAAAAAAEPASELPRCRAARASSTCRPARPPPARPAAPARCPPPLAPSPPRPHPAQPWWRRATQSSSPTSPPASRPR
jgi:hypothetical protein